MLPPMLAAGLCRCPSLLPLCSDWVGGDEADAQLTAMHAARKFHVRTERVVLEGDTGHQNYTDFALLAPRVLRALGMIGSAPARGTLAVVNAPAKDFMARELRGAD
eukprot:SAG11_NODE_339_length_10506_cov_12.368588_5_plen_106_part_00